MSGTPSLTAPLVLVNQFYPPDHAPTGVYLEALAGALCRQGVPVCVLTGRTGYDGDRSFLPREDRHGVAVRRVWTPRLGRGGGLARLAGYLCFAWGVWWRLSAGPRPRAVLALTTPPFLGWIVALAARWRGIPHLHWVMDVWPDALVADRPARTGWRRWVLDRLGHVARRHLGGARAVIALGEGMACRLQRYRKQSTTVAPLWATVTRPEADVVAAMRRQMGWTDAEVVLAYCGNLGRGHRWRDFAEAAARSEPGLRWVVIGGGVRRRELDAWCEEHPEVRIDRLPYVAEGDLPALLAAVDVHLVSVERGWEGVVVPSKVQNLLAVGRPALVVAPAASEPARWVLGARAGWVVEPDDREGLLRAVSDLRNARSRTEAGMRALGLARDRFLADRAVDLAASIGVAIDPQWRFSTGAQT